MNSRKKWIKIWFFTILLIPIVAIFNFIVNPYSIFDSDFLSVGKPEQETKVRLLKAVKIKEIKPASLILGTSRAEGTYNPKHDYFLKPSYNGATSGSSIYENLQYLKLAIKQGNLKQVLLVSDYRMFNGGLKKSISDFDTYFFNDFNKNKYLFSIDTLKNSIRTFTKKKDDYLVYLEDGFKVPYTKLLQDDVLKDFYNIEMSYYKKYKKGYSYSDSSSNPMEDFKSFVSLCYKNNINLQIIFGPSHIRLWESMDYYLGIETLYNWKKEIVSINEKVAKEYNKKAFLIKDFSIYHELTNEKVPLKKNVMMKYHYESSHYTPKMGEEVLNSLLGKSSFDNFGIDVNLANIEKHIQTQKELRKKYIDVDKYKKDLEEKLKN